MEERREVVVRVRTECIVVRREASRSLEPAEIGVKGPGPEESLAFSVRFGGLLNSVTTSLTVLGFGSPSSVAAVSAMDDNIEIFTLPGGCLIFVTSSRLRSDC